MKAQSQGAGSEPDKIALRIKNMETVSKNALEIGEELDKFHGPIWTAQIEFLKTIITLASGSLVLTVTFSGSLLTRPTPPQWPWFLFISWLCFSATVISGIVGIWQAAGLRSLPARLHNKTPEFCALMEQCSVDGSDLIVKMQEAVSATTTAIKPFDTRLCWAQRVAFVAFVGAVLSLAVFGWRQFS